MRPRDLLILCAVLAAAASAGLYLLSTSSLGPELPPDSTAAAPDAPGAPPPPGPAASTPLVNAPVAATAPTDTTGWTHGTIRGDVSIAVSVLDKIQSISVAVEEMRKPVGPDGRFTRPWNVTVPVEMGVGTPTFEVTKIPFSEYPYSVRLFSPGLNGSSRTGLSINANSALHDVELRITPGAPFTVRLRDQDQTPYHGMDVRMLPVGDPPGRPPHQGITDNFGCVVFDSVLEGEYDVVAQQNGAQIGDRQRILVQQGLPVRDKVQGQSHLMTLPRGVPLEVFVSTPSGYRVADALVRVQSDRVQLQQFEAHTDFNGRVLFPHLTPGVWLVDVRKDDHQPTTSQITIKDREAPPPKHTTLVRLR